MKCKDCPIMKYDGETYTCPAHMHRSFISMYTETSCNAMDWYPKYLTDQLGTQANNIRQLDEILVKLYGLLQSYKQAEGYTKYVVDELKSVYDRYGDRMDFMIKDAFRLREELSRIQGDSHGKN